MADTSKDAQFSGGHIDISGRPNLDLAAAGVTSRIVQAGYAYWLSLAGDRLPARSEVDPIQMRSLPPHVVIIGVKREPLDFQIRLIGEDVRRHMA